MQSLSDKENTPIRVNDAHMHAVAYSAGSKQLFGRALKCMDYLKHPLES